VTFARSTTPAPAAVADDGDVSGIYLYEDRLGVLSLDCDSGYVLKSIDLGFPKVRDNTQDRAMQDGSFDVTYLVGSRAVSLAFVLDGSKSPTGGTQRLLDRLAAYCYPMVRPTLYWLPVGEPDQRKLALRGVDCPALIDNVKYPAVVAQFVSGAPMIESADEHVQIIPFNTGVPSPGRHYWFVYNKSYPVGGAGEGAVQIVNAGSATASWWARIYGPCNTPTLEINDTQMTFSRLGGLTLAAGSYVEIRSRERTITADNGESRYPYYDFTAGVWPVLLPGPNAVRYYGVSAGAESVVEFHWNDAWV